MKNTLLLLTTALFLHVGIPSTHAAGNVSVDFFYDQLGDYGDWVEVGDYGYGWQPRDVEEDWRPYSDGRWAYTEAGWTWISDEPYGWAVYHYGRWARIERKGWVWIPGTEWAPAWVSWRRSPRHVGWAPLPPEARFRRNVGFSGWVDSYYDIGPSAYRFVEVRNFGAPRLRVAFVDPRENITIIQQTTNITNITYVNSTVYNQGPRYEEISRESAEPIRRLKLDRQVEIEGDRASFRGEQMRSRVDGDSLRVFAPGFDARAAAAPPRKLSEKIEKVEVNRGWADAGPPADVEKLRAKVRGEAKAPKDLPPQPKFERLTEQAEAPEAAPAKGDPAPVAPGEKPGRKGQKEGRNAKEPSVAPPLPPKESNAAPLENPAAPEAPMKPQKPGKPGKPADLETPGRPGAEPAGTEEKTGRKAPPTAEPVQPGRKGKDRKPPQPAPAAEPKEENARPKAVQQMPPAPGRPAQGNERSLPPEPAPRREAPEPKKPKVERPEAAREVVPPVERARPKSERANPPTVAPGKAPQPATDAAERPKPGKGKGKDRLPEDEAPKTQ